jgi:hypothetical protein
MTGVPIRFRLRRDSAADWTSNNPVLLLGEPGIETDTRKIKYGDGATAWNSLGYSATDLDADLVAIAALSPANDDVLQRKSGAWTNRTLAQLKTDLALTDEGTWTPAFGSSGTAPICTYLNQSGTYRRVGKLMTLFGELYVDTLTPGTGELRITGFPTAPANARYNGTVSIGASLGWTTKKPIGGYVHNGGSYATLTVDTSATSQLDCPTTNLAAGALLTFSITYALA